MANTTSTKWVGGPLFIKIKPGSRTGTHGGSHGQPVGRRKTRWYYRLMVALAKGKRARSASRWGK